MSISRRQFLETTAIAGLATTASANGTLPTRTLGKTGAKVSILAFGGGSRFLMHKPDEKAYEALNKALDMGITYVDSAQSYGNGESERLIGHVMKTRRKGVFLVTKVQNRDGSQTRRLVEESMRKLNTSQMDLIHIHGLGNAEDLAKIEVKGGVLDELQKLKSEKVTRFIGITCHADPSVLKTALERHEFDCTQMALNAARAGSANLKAGTPATPAGMSFEDLALPVARRKKMGVIAMKVFGQEHLVGRANPKKLLYYPLSLDGVHVAVAGMPKIEHIEQNITAARAFQPLPKSELQQLAMSLREEKLALDRFFADHVDA
jgi:predicted aldo/keto reductase-like oxidoreductase